MTPDTARLRARIAARARHTPDDPRLLADRQALAVHRLTAEIAAGPPLTAEQQALVVVALQEHANGAGEVPAA